VPHPSVPPGFYRRDIDSGRSLRLVRAPSRDRPESETSTPVAARAPWPDTLSIRFFDDAADEEIALERGELDVAVFWPGELSSQVRDHPRWQGFEYGTRSRGVVAALWLGGEAPGEIAEFAAAADSILASLNQDLFRGDLAPWVHASEPREPPHADPMLDLEFRVDPACPGKATLERFLGRDDRTRSSSRGDGRGSSASRARHAWIFYLDAPVARDSLALHVARYVSSGDFPSALRARADSLIAEAARGASRDRGIADSIARGVSVEERAARLGVSLHFTVRCPVLVTPALRAYVGAIGAEGFADLIDCRSAGRRP